MRCGDEGQLRAYLDDELGAAERASFAAHLDGCDRCARALSGLRAEAQYVGVALARWLPDPILTDPVPTERRAGAALARFQATLREERRAIEVVPSGPFDRVKEQMTAMFRRLTTPRMRPALAALSIVTVLALALAFTPLNSLADQLFKTFRVQRFAAVTVPVPAMKDLPQAQQITPEQQQQIMQLLAPLGTLQTNATKDTFAQVPDAAAAKVFLAQYGATLQVPGQLPTAFSGQSAQYGTAKPTSSSYTLNVDVAKQYLAMANQPALNGLKWPDGVTQLTFGLDTPAAVATFYGNKEQGFGIVQMANLPGGGDGAGPTLKLPSELSEMDLNAFRAALLGMPGLPQDTVRQLESVSDWTHTLIIPVPETARTEDVDIKSGMFTTNKGLLILDGEGRGSLLVWQDNGIMYAIGGTLSKDEILLIANNLTNAR